MKKYILVAILTLCTVIVGGCGNPVNSSTSQPASTTVPTQMATPTPVLPSAELDESWFNFINGTFTEADEENIIKGIDIFINTNIGPCVKNETLVDSSNAAYFFGITNHSLFNDLPRIDFEQEIINTWKDSEVTSFTEYNIVFEQLTDMSGEDEYFYMMAFLAN